MKLNFYYRLYLLFYLISGKKNSPELTAIMLLSTYLYCVFLLLVFFAFWFLDQKAIIDYSQYISEHKSLVKYGLFGLGLVFLGANMLLFVPKSSTLIKSLDNNHDLKSRLARHKSTLLVSSLLIIVLIFTLSGKLY